ncbi:DUF6585 family protein [Streptomyces sp. NPDC048111]|uniref:DUF6585 family protein n=1 Tax=Streptomyces sp. NPDC048111 TaxID=3365500 RepID=UPI00371FBC87
MTGPAPRTRGEELLLARVSAAAGRARLGRRLATHPVTAHRPRTGVGLRRVIRRLSARARDGRSPARASPNARLDLYEHGMTVALEGRIHVVRYDTTSVFHHGAGPLDPVPPATAVIRALTDVDHKCLVLYGGSGDGDAHTWEHALEQAVTRARLPGALVALRRGERVSFGEVWLTSEQVGSATMRMPWTEVQRIGVSGAFLSVTVGGRRRRLGPAVSRIPNVFVFRALADHCRSRDAP